MSYKGNRNFQPANDRSSNKLYIHKFMQEHEDDVIKLCELWISECANTKLLVQKKLTTKIRNSKTIDDLFYILAETHKKSKHLRDSLGSEFSPKIRLFRESRMKCGLSVWKKAIPALRALGIFEENTSFYVETPY